MKPFRSLLRRWAVPVLIRTACVLSLAALGFTVAGILVPRPLPVMAGSSFGQGLIFLALGCYTLAVFADSIGGGARRDPDDDGRK